jgi:hypothetical protein
LADIATTVLDAAVGYVRERLREIVDDPATAAAKLAATLWRGVVGISQPGRDLSVRRGGVVGISQPRRDLFRRVGRTCPDISAAA